MRDETLATPPDKYPMQSYDQSSSCCYEDPHRNCKHGHTQKMKHCESLNTILPTDRENSTKNQTYESIALIPVLGVTQGVVAWDLDFETISVSIPMHESNTSISQYINTWYDLRKRSREECRKACSGERDDVDCTRNLENVQSAPSQIISWIEEILRKIVKAVSHPMRSYCKWNLRTALYQQDLYVTDVRQQDNVYCRICCPTSEPWFWWQHYTSL